MIGKVLWASPWNETSAIAFFGMQVIRQLEAVGIQVDVLRSETGPFLNHPAPPPTTGQVFAPGSLSPHEILTNYDCMIANFGDHFGFHGALLPLLFDTAPLAIFHDAWMGHLFNGWRQNLETADRSTADLIGGLETDPSGLSAIAAMTSGVVVHGPHYKDIVQAACAGPVTTIPLAYTFDPIAPPKLDSERLIVATAGHINQNKRADEVLRALGLSARLREKVTYLLVGPVQNRERNRLLDVARRWRAPEPTFTGWLEDEVMRATLETADVICCLRDPCLEGGSASLVTALLSSRPTLVSDQAHYAELPDDVVMKCSPGREAPDIVRHLESILDAPDKARAMGLRARDYALTNHTPEIYAVRLIEVMRETIARSPMIRAARRLGAQLSWLGAKPDDPVVARAGRSLDNLLGNSTQP